MLENELLEKLRKIERLHAGATTPGEQDAAADAIRRIRKRLADIEKIVVKNVNGIPVLIRDVATVQFGVATRYGAVTRNGEGEVVAGITLMLKGENFAKVIASSSRGL